MDNTIKIEVTLNQLNVILSGLAKLPLGESLETFSVVRQQADQQIQPASGQRPDGPLSNKIIN